MNWWMADAWQQSPALLVSWVFWVIFSICLHELGHGVAAIRRGDRTPIESGHMTLNPLVHMGAVSLIMFALFGFTWGAMPVDPGRFRGRHAEAFVAFAGPAVNLTLAALCVVAAAVWLRFGGRVDPEISKKVFIFVTTGAMINVMGFVFNLLPVPPLDGSRILSDFVPSYERLFRTEQGALFGLVLFAVLFSVAGRKLWNLAETVSAESIALVYRAIGGGAVP